MNPNGPSENDPRGYEFLIGEGAASVPVFSCVVYLSTHDGPGVRARVANLAGLQCHAATEREALSQIVAAFKHRVSELLQSETPIPWVEPISSAEAGEQTRFIPVHL
jgi:hypothetical protein